MGFTDLVIHTGVIQDSLSCRRFTGINVSHDTDIAHMGEIFKHSLCFCHIYLTFVKLLAGICGRPVPQARRHNYQR